MLYLQNCTGFKWTFSNPFAPINLNSLIFSAYRKFSLLGAHNPIIATMPFTSKFWKQTSEWIYLFPSSDGRNWNEASQENGRKVRKVWCWGSGESERHWDRRVYVHSEVNAQGRQQSLSLRGPSRTGPFQRHRRDPIFFYITLCFCKICKRKIS